MRKTNSMIGALSRIPRGTRIGECLSGLLIKPRQSVTSRIVLATETAWRRVHSPQVHEELRRKIEAKGRLGFGLFRDEGILRSVYKNGKGAENYGLFAPTDENDEKLVDDELEEFKAALRQLTSVERGVHRRVFLAMMGVAADEEMDDLSDDLYCKMMAKICRDHKDPSLKQIGSLKLSQSSKFDQIRQLADGTLEIVFSLTNLAKYSFWTHPSPL